MNLVTDMKKLNAKNFREGKIRQASFLKSFKEEIIGLVSLGYKPSEIKDYLEEKLSVTINMNSFYAWLNYTKSHSLNTKHTETIGMKQQAVSMSLESKPEKSTLDVLSSTDFD